MKLDFILDEVCEADVLSKHAEMLSMFSEYAQFVIGEGGFDDDRTLEEECIWGFFEQNTEFNLNGSSYEKRKVLSAMNLVVKEIQIEYLKKIILQRIRG